MTMNNYLQEDRDSVEGFNESGVYYPVIPVVNWAKENCEIIQIDLSNYPLEKILMNDSCTMLDMLKSYHKLLNADLSYPIVLTYRNSIADGHHRLLKAIYEDRSHISAYKLPGPVSNLSIDWSRTSYN